MVDITEETPVTQSLDEIEAQAGEETPDEVPEDQETTDQDQADDDEDIIIIDGKEPEEEEPKAESSVIRELRDVEKRRAKRIKELEQKLSQYEQQTPKTIDPGPKPTLENCDYDSDQYEQKLSDWYDKKRQLDAQKAQEEEQNRAQAIEQQKIIEGYHEKKRSLKVRDYDTAESIVAETLTVPQQNIIVEGAENPALVVYALGKNPDMAKKLAAIKVPARFAFEVAKFEGSLKLGKRKPKTAPEKTIKGTGSISGAVDSNLERLRAEAERTGNYSKVLQYKRSKRKAG